MKAKKGKFRYWKMVSGLLAIALILTVCTGCPGSTTTLLSTPLKWETVQSGTEIEKLNVVLVIDISASTERNDPANDCREAACMFLNTLYASASQTEAKRLQGSKKIKASVILYNDTFFPYHNDTLFDLSRPGTAKDLNSYIRYAQYPRGGDDALTDALSKAVYLLDSNTQKGELSERSLVLLFSDGYTTRYGTKLSASALDNSDPDFGDGRQTRLLNTLTSASENDYEIFALMFNPDESTDGGWEQFKKVSERTRRNSMAEFMKVYMSHRDVFEGLSWTDLSTPKGYTLLQPTFLHDPMYGGGIFTKPDSDKNADSSSIPYGGGAYGGGASSGENPYGSTGESSYSGDSSSSGAGSYGGDGSTANSGSAYGGGAYGGGASGGGRPGGDDDKVNYLMADSLAKVMEFYTTLAANMLAGTSAEKLTPGGTLKKYHYSIEIANRDISALMCFFYSKDGIKGNEMEGPDPDNPGERKDYTRILLDQDNEGWANNGTMRNDWYFHETPEGKHIAEDGSLVQFNIAALTIINPEPGTWDIFIEGDDEQNTSMGAYAVLVSGAKTHISFAQGSDPAGSEHPLTGGDFAIQMNGNQEQPMPEEFYAALKTENSITKIPPWFPISMEKDAWKADVADLMKDFPSWLENKLGDFKRPDPFLMQISGGAISFEPGEYKPDDATEGKPALMGHFEAPLPGLYYVILNMTSGEGVSQIDYSKSFWVMYEPKTSEIRVRANHDITIGPSFFPSAWGKISNANVPDSEKEDLVLNIDKQSLSISPPNSNVATVQFDSKNPDVLIIHGKETGTCTLSFNVTTKYGDKWTLSYDIVVP